jgi:hypothetical protein
MLDWKSFQHFAADRILHFQIQAVQEVTVHGLIDSEDEDTTILQNVGAIWQ